jgi:hypothetical protein
MKYLLFIGLLLIFSCAKKTYTFRGKKVTEKQFDRKLKKFTDKFVNDNPEFVELWNGVEVVYDTTKSQ